MPKPLPSPELLRKLLRYEPDTGRLFWREGTRQFSRQSSNGAGTLDSHGYYQIKISGRIYQVHRVCYAIHHGIWPNNHIDHINGDRTDNKIDNLRDITRSENMKNMKLKSNNSSGFAGVHFDKLNKKWRAQIMVNGRWKHLGRFESIDDAVSARNAAEKEYGYHENHGRD